MECETMYHYCGVETFLNIIRNHTLRLSDLCKSTNRLELKSLLRVIQEEVMKQYRNNKDFVDSVIYGMDMDEAFSFMLQALISKMEKNSDQMLFGVCFSEEGDMLGQWRKYADKGTGLAIGFDPGWFQHLCEDDMFMFSKVAYGYEEENEDIVTGYASSIYDEMLMENDGGCLKPYRGWNMITASVWSRAADLLVRWSAFLCEHTQRMPGRKAKLFEPARKNIVW